MSLFTRPLEAATEQDLQNLVDAKFAEWKTVEYKESLSVDNDIERKKFLSQVSSFANASGGHLIYGIRADSGVPVEVCGLNLVNPDAMILRLEDMVRDGIRLRIPSLQFRAIPVKTDRTAIVIRIPKSWALPHQVVYNKEFRFYSRSSNGKYILDVEELRNLFNLSATTAGRIRDFRTVRLSQIIADETPVKLDKPPRVVLHIIPLSAFDLVARFDVSSIARNINDLLPMSGGGYNPRYNLDGYLTYSQNEGVAYAYLQVFRNGIIESVRATYDSSGRGPRLIPNKALETDVLEALRRFLRIQKQLGVEPPLMVMLSLLGVSGYALTTDTLHGLGGHLIDRDVLQLPDVLVEHYNHDPEEVMRDIFNAMWNAAGYEYCKNYAGRGKGKRQ